MAWDGNPSSLLEELPVDLDCCVVPKPGLLVADPPAEYRPRHPENTVFYQLFESYFDSYVRTYEQRFEPRSGLLRPVVVRSVEEFLSCGRLQGGFARLRCPKLLLWQATWDEGRKPPGHRTRLGTVRHGE